VEVVGFISQVRLELVAQAVVVMVERQTPMEILEL
jgi:hypothetical protein